MDKATLRQQIWDDLEDSGVARFPFPPHDRIPNVAGAEAAADRLAATDAWERADAIKANPDAPQLPVRRRALREGKTVYLAVPRLRDEHCFVELDPATIDDYDAAPTVSHLDEYGRRVPPEAVESVDLIVSGSVAVDERGARVGKGEGFSDLEYALLRECGLVDDATPVATTVHERQIVDADWQVDVHDVPMDIVVTPERTIHTETDLATPDGVDWAALSDEQIAAMPPLAVRAPDAGE